MQPDREGSPWEQIKFIGYELSLLTDGKRVRWLVIFFEYAASVIISYRLDRCGYLLFGRSWFLLRILAWPVFFGLRLWGCHHEICCKARIGRGLRITHPSMGIAIHADAIIGQNCFMNGGNCVGIRKPMKRGELVLGDNVRFGIHACVLGPAIIGSQVNLGAGAVVVSDLPDNVTAVGVPARLQTKDG